MRTSARILFLVLLSAALLLACFEASDTDGTPLVRPNVLVILADDLGFGDVGCYGASDVATPNLDRMAGEGVRLTDFYGAGPVCTPSRAALLTGRYPQRFGLEWSIGPNQTGRGLAATEASLARLLKGHGYATGLVGKWHLGYDPEFSPQAHGFDEFFGLRGGCHDYYTHLDPAGSLDLFEGTARVRREGYTTDLLTRRAVRFIDEHARDPFFLMVSYTAPHSPYQPPDVPPGEPRSPQTAAEWLEGTREDYVRMVERLDQGIGAVLAALEERRLAEDTLVVFAVDNGAAGPARNDPLAGGKPSLLEGGIRVACILRWPARIAGGRVARVPAITMDLTATVLAAAGAAPLANSPLDGIDLLPLLNGAAPAADRPLCWRVERPDMNERAVRRGRFKYLRTGYLEHLFDLEADIGETDNLLLRHPGVVRRLRQALFTWERDVNR